MKLKTLINRLQSIADKYPEMLNKHVCTRNFALCYIEPTAKVHFINDTIVIESKRYIDYLNSED